MHDASGAGAPRAAAADEGRQAAKLTEPEGLGTSGLADARPLLSRLSRLRRLVARLAGARVLDEAHEVVAKPHALVL